MATQNNILEQFNNMQKMPIIGEEVCGRWHKGIKWTLGVFIGETKNGFEVYNYTIKEDKFIEYYFEITTEPDDNSGIIFKSDNFKGRK